MNGTEHKLSLSGIVAINESTHVHENNLYYPRVDSDTDASRSFAGDPKFVDLERGDFRLTQHSPARDQGLPTSLIFTDYEGQDRDGRIDLGAHEFVP